MDTRRTYFYITYKCHKLRVFDSNGAFRKSLFSFTGFFNFLLKFINILIPQQQFPIYRDHKTKNYIRLHGFLELHFFLSTCLYSKVTIIINNDNILYFKIESSPVLFDPSDVTSIFYERKYRKYFLCFLLFTTTSTSIFPQDMWQPLLHVTTSVLPYVIPPDIYVNFILIVHWVVRQTTYICFPIIQSWNISVEHFCGTFRFYSFV